MDSTSFLLKISKQRQLTLPKILEISGFQINQPVKAYINQNGNLEIEKPVEQFQSLRGILKGRTEHDFTNINEARAYANTAKYKRK